MKSILSITIILLVNTTLFSVDLSTQNRIYESENFVVYSEDANDYSELIELVEAKNKDFETIFSREISKKIYIYIFKDQISFSKHVFNSDTPIQDATGLADHVSMNFYITSYYDTCKSKERLLQTPIHELVHIYFPSGCVWIREGIACYYAEMLTEIPSNEIPKNFSEIYFYSHGASETKKAYNCSSWIVKYILEELLDNNLEEFRTYESNPSNYSLLGFNDEADFFSNWNNYVLLNDS